MQHIIGIFLKDNEHEILENENPGNGSYMGLAMTISNAQAKLNQNPNIKQINIYSIKQGQRILDYQLFCSPDSA